MSTFSRTVADTDRTGAVSAHRASPTARRAALLVGVALLSLLTACNDGTPQGSPKTVPGTAGPASGDTGTKAGSTPAASPAASTPSKKTGTGTGSGSAPATATTGSGSGGGSGRCHTSELRASVGRNDPGAGQENFPVVLTNRSGRTCTVRGYPGAAFVDASGKQLGPDPRRSPGTPTTVVLAPGHSAWSGLTFSNPGISGAATATPASLIVTPPDELDSLTVAWTQGEVPVSGNASSVRLTVLSPGTAP
ncbi:DUF4232 domain-containing protein [Streptomyces triticiradicis]|uniref:DUF4232 domain-containing protein n=1 Tax=Streptomyces triticiradicis TaxID=2651189 RepID=A0A7J5DNP7_9ACTN|nr:DUF4232 domain-containing protein [Streptomyces triticiradicis]KAB1990393.1 DUF4232 domain-containing protein [Streptomyces triticiradicis]